jgi:hypothetical protein
MVSEVNAETAFVTSLSVRKLLLTKPLLKCRDCVRDILVSYKRLSSSLVELKPAFVTAIDPTKASVGARNPGVLKS